jgi:hypothetical protein
MEDYEHDENLIMNRYKTERQEAEKTEGKKEMPSFMQKLFGKK